MIIGLSSGIAATEVETSQYKDYKSIGKKKNYNAPPLREVSQKNGLKKDSFLPYSIKDWPFDSLEPLSSIFIHSVEKNSGTGGNRTLDLLFTRQTLWPLSHSATVDFANTWIPHGLHSMYPPITYCWTVPLILDHLYLVGNLTSSRIAHTKVSGF